MTSNPVPANGYDDNTTVMTPIVDPTYKMILDLDEHTECVAYWPDGTIDAFDIDTDFKDHMRKGMNEKGMSLHDPAGPTFIIVVPPHKMHPGILMALQLLEKA